MKINFKKSIVKYTVETNNLKKGTITAIELPEIKVGDFERNIQFVDNFGNNMGRDGTITKILEIRIVG